ncbi:MAG TPA: rhomboid family intramembrane serine protease [Candidatus Kapabacteria bacterium]|nr:rhomboid family intramembrane serine protease [Candidatus Kapabacteria bacterium]
MNFKKYRSDYSYRPQMGGFSFMPPMIRFLLIANVTIFAAVALLGNIRISGTPLEEWITYWFALWPVDSQAFHPWQLITYMFLHGGLAHIFFNMFALWMFGMELENVWGSRRFAVYYFVCGLGAAFSQLYIAPFFSVPAPTIGASGGIFGLLLAFGLMFPDRLIYLYFFLPIKAKYFVIGYILLELWAIGGASDVAHLAHLGGAAVGFLYLLVEDKIPVDDIFNRIAALFKKRPDLQYRQGGQSIFTKSNTVDADYKDVGSDDKNDVSQEVIDRILDKIGRSGYQNLTEEEKKILFEASKKIH